MGTALFALVLPVCVAMTAIGGLRRGDGGPTYRFTGAFALGFSALFAVLMAWTAALQADVASWQDSPGILLPLVGSVVIAIGVGTVGWFLQPATVRSPRRSQAFAAIDIGQSERIAWLRTSTMSRGAMVLLVAIAVALTIGTVIGWLAGSAATAWILTATTVLVVALMAIMTVFHIRIDRDGLLVRSAAGFPRFHVALADIRAVDVVAVNPVGEFGGVGIRRAPHRLGVVLRSGEALAVSRADGPEFVVTVDDARTAAAVLEAFLRRDLGGEADSGKSPHHG
ncbi:hypothetical protein VR010_06045 [Actinomycetaceae bacterium L2_0104]